jgi:hypothetical protein
VAHRRAKIFLLSKSLFATKTILAPVIPEIDNTAADVHGCVLAEFHATSSVNKDLQFAALQSSVDL